MRLVAKSGPIAVSAFASSRLNSWKEIASYLGRDPRTVQLWEKQEGLPVHRHAHKSRSSVYANSAEIDSWLQARSAKTGSSEIQEEAELTSSAGRRKWVIAACTLLGASVVAAAGWMLRQRMSARQPGMPTIVVLAFQDQNASDDAITDSLTSDVTRSLRTDGRVRVVSLIRGENSAHLSARRIQDEYRSSYALRGRLAESGDEAAVTVELLDAARDEYVWDATIVGKAAAFRSGHEQIASQITAAVLSHMVQEDAGTTAAPSVESASPRHGLRGGLLGQGTPAQ